MEPAAQSTVAAEARAALVIKSIIREIVAACAEHQHVVSEDLAAFMVKSVVLDPVSGFKSESEMTKDDVAELVNACVGKLTDGQSISVATVKMQVHFGHEYMSYADAVQLFRDRQSSQMRDVEIDICESSAGSRDECELLYRKIASSVLMRSGVGSPTDIAVVRETTAGLESVLPPVELGTFAALTARQKQKQLRDLAGIVTGIRLFNKHCGKGGASIPDLETELSESCQNLLLSFRANIKRFTELATLYSSAMDATPGEDRWISPLMNARQYTTYASLLQRDVSAVSETVASLAHRQRRALDDLKTTVQSKAAVPTDQVYPQFITLAEILTELQEAQCFMQIVETLAADLLPFTRNQNAFAEHNSQELTTIAVPPHIKAVADLLKDESAALTCESLRLLGVAAEAVEPPAPQPSSDGLTNDMVSAAKGQDGAVELLTPGQTHGYEWLALHNGGFCLASTTAEVPAVLPVDRTLGILKYNGRCYGFATLAAAQAFLKDIDTMLALVVDNAKRHPELIELLQLHEYFATDLQGGMRLGPFQGRDAPIMSNSGIQTDLHPVESNIVKGYESNEWELRRRAIHLANLRQKKTHSTQTTRSNYRREAETQVYLPKNTVTQTRRDASTSVPKPVTYIKGLRGARGPKAQAVEVIDLTLDIGGIALDVRGLTGGRK